MADWDEAEHPRDRVGRFRDKAGGGWVGAVFDRIRGGSRYKRVEGRDLSDEVIGRAGHFTGVYLDPNTYGDEVAGEIAQMQGFDGPPTVGTAAELDEAIAEGGTELWRGYRGALPQWSEGYGEDPGRVYYPTWGRVADHIEQWRSGQYTAGSGIYGQGTYTSVDRRVMERFGEPMEDRAGRTVAMVDPRSVARMVLSPDARVIDFHDNRLKAYMRRLYAGITPESLEQGVLQVESELAGIDLKRSDFDDHHWSVLIGAAKKKAMALLGDRGRAAAALGFDAMHVPPGEKHGDGSNIDAPQYVILNRTALLVQEAYDENLLPPEVIRTWEAGHD